MTCEECKRKCKRDWGSYAEYCSKYKPRCKNKEYAEGDWKVIQYGWNYDQVVFYKGIPVIIEGHTKVALSYDELEELLDYVKELIRRQGIKEEDIQKLYLGDQNDDFKDTINPHIRKELGI